MPEATALESPAISDTFPNDFDDWMMDIDGEGDDGYREMASEDDSEDSEDEEIEEPGYANPIDSDEEVDFFHDEDKPASDGESYETDETDIPGFESSDPDDVDNIVLLLQKLRALSGTNLHDFADV